MKTQLLALLAPLNALAASLPDDAPAGLSIVRLYGNNEPGIPLSIELTFDEPPAGMTPVLEVIGAPGNAAGPQDWTPIPVNAAPTGPNAVRATYQLYNPDGQHVIFRLRYQAADGAFSPESTLAFP